MAYVEVIPEKKPMTVVYNQDKWCKYRWQTWLTQCQWIQPWLWDTVDPCWLSGGHLGSKHLAVWQVSFWVLLLALQALFSVFSTEQSKKETGQCLLRLQAISLARVQCLIVTSKGLEKHVWWRFTGFPFLQETLSSLISWLLLLSYQRVDDGEKRTQDTINPNTQAHGYSGKIQLIHPSRQPLYLICCLAPLLFHSLCLTHADTTGIQWHGPTLSSVRKKGCLAWPIV